MTICLSCGHQNLDGNKFCGECAAPLGAPARGVAEERKVVSVLFCDLIGFTAASEQADPEDVDTMLSAYAEMARARIEAHGGVVEKFIGDAVVGVFGVPAAHEDDPERAVRAGLRIVEARGGVGGDRWCAAAAAGGCEHGRDAGAAGCERCCGGARVGGGCDQYRLAAAVGRTGDGCRGGLSTFEATAVVFDYEELEPRTLKGKAEPVRVFHAKARGPGLGRI